LPSLPFENNKDEQKKTHSLIHTPRRRPIQIRPQVDPQTLVLAHIPSSNILALDAGRAPRQSIALVSKSAQRILARRERDRQIGGASTRRAANISIQLRSLGIDDLDQLAVYNLELARCCGVGEDCAAGGGVEGGGLQVFVEVGGGDGADPGVAALEGGACACAGGAACWLGGGCGGA
jgi:hypothetical protein